MEVIIIYSCLRQCCLLWIKVVQRILEAHLATSTSVLLLDSGLAEMIVSYLRLLSPGMLHFLHF